MTLLQDSSEEIRSPVAVLSVHTNAAIEAGVSGIGAAGLVGLVPSRAGAHGGGLQSHRH